MHFFDFQMYKTCLKCSFFRVDPMLVRADTKHSAVQRLTGFYLVTGLTASGLTDCIFFKAFLPKG